MRDAFDIDGQEHELWLSRDAAATAPLRGGQASAQDARATTGPYRLHWNDGQASARLQACDNGTHLLHLGNDAVPVLIAQRGDDLFIHMDGEAWELKHRHPLDRAAATGHSHADDEMRSPMPGTVVAVKVAAGQAVARGDALLVMESMKLETTIVARRDGTVEAVHVSAGQTFERDALLVTLATQEEGQ